MHTYERDSQSTGSPLTILHYTCRLIYVKAEFLVRVSHDMKSTFCVKSRQPSIILISTEKVSIYRYIKLNK